MDTQTIKPLAPNLERITEKTSDETNSLTLNLRRIIPELSVLNPRERSFVVALVVYKLLSRDERVTSHDVLKDIEAETGMPEENIKSNMRDSYTSSLRGVAFYMYRNRGLSYSDAGRKTRKDHSTVIPGCKKVKKGLIEYNSIIEKAFLPSEDNKNLDDSVIRGYIPENVRSIRKKIVKSNKSLVHALAFSQILLREGCLTRDNLVERLCNLAGVSVHDLKYGGSGVGRQLIYLRHVGCYISMEHLGCDKSTTGDMFGYVSAVSPLNAYEVVKKGLKDYKEEIDRELETIGD